MGWACGAYEWGEGVYRILVGKPEGKRPLGRPRRRWVDNIRLDLQEVGYTNFFLITYTSNATKTFTFPPESPCIYLLTYSMEQSPSWEANRLSASQEIPRIL